MSRFRTYLEGAFHLTPHESEEVMSAFVKPLKKSIRINTHKISREDFMLHAREQGWTLTETDIPEVFLIDREDTSLALGRTLEHQLGWFYIQELAAAHPPFLLKEEIRKNKEERNAEVDPRIKPEDGRLQGGTIIDMCAAPGGKTTQLADYFPDSLIIANEVNRSRTPQLFDNLDRMGYENIAVVSCDGRFFQNFPEYFDAVLLDAPCSGEGTAFRDSSVIDHWHEKNIHRIAKLQKQLFETAMTIVKPGGFISYSTCTLNLEENEHVIALEEENQKDESKPPLIHDGAEPSGGARECVSDDTIPPTPLASKGELFRRLYQKRFWPHIEHTGGFFASIFQKQSSHEQARHYRKLPLQGQKPYIRAATKGEREVVDRFVLKYFQTALTSGYLFVSRGQVFFSRRNLSPDMQYWYFVHIGVKIGEIDGTTFTPSHHLWWYLEDTKYISQIELGVDMLSNLATSGTCAVSLDDGFYAVKWGRGCGGVGCVSRGVLSFPTL